MADEDPQWEVVPADELPAAVAVPLVRTLALRHGMQRVIERLEAIPAGELATACNAYAHGFRRGETPLILVDNSTRRNFKGGMLLTTRALYSSICAHPIPLAAIRDVRFEQPEVRAAGCLAEFLFGSLATMYMAWKHGSPKAGLTVNGDLVFCAGLKWVFWIDVLSGLAVAARARTGFGDGGVPLPGGWG